MKVILLKDVRGVGQHHQVKDVADGYAINFLLPKKLAEVATEAKVKQLEEQKQEHETGLQKQEEELSQLVQSLNGKKVTIQARATPKGGLFRGITAEDIVKALATEHNVTVPSTVVHFPEPIKTVGEHKVLLQSKTKKADLTALVAAVQ